MKLIVFAMLAAACLAQEGQPVNLSEGPPITAYQHVYGFTGTNLIYDCMAASSVTSGVRAQTVIAISAASNANPVVFTSTGHGFQLNTRPKVTISGATSGWTAINGTFVATVIDANSFSIPVDSTAFGALSGTITFTTTAPRTTLAEWAVKKYFYDGSSNLIGQAWLLGSTGLQAKCSDASGTTVQLQ